MHESTPPIVPEKHDAATRLHHWIQPDKPHLRMRLDEQSRSTAVCAYCGIAYKDAPSMDGCPGRSDDDNA